MLVGQFFNVVQLTYLYNTFLKTQNINLQKVYQPIQVSSIKV